MSRLAPLLGALLLCAALPVWADPPPRAAPELRLRVVGGLGGLTQYAQLEAPFWTRDLPRLSQGRFEADVVPFDRAGVPAVDMLRLLQLGVVPFGTVLLSSLADRYPQYMAADLPGLNPDLATLRRSLAAFRPQLEQVLREDHGIELLAVYVYPAQVLFCKRPLASLADLRGRRVRVSSTAQGDFVAALGAIPRLVPFAQLAQSMEAGASECAITGAMPGNTLGLHLYANYLYPMPINWGMAFFGANRAAWQSLPEDLRTLLRAELPRLETAIWLSAEQESQQGVDCNLGRSRCTTGRRGQMQLVPVRAQDEARRDEVFRSAVLPRWLQRCGARCAALWTRAMVPAQGLPVEP
ncbi:MAG: TRAP transporter substrate-binding protein [Proteobacteria bacterium]|nr:TRAP transporter substrate-binding protein [Pseudomonadota bacterium]